jgi:(R,R)-butanediol dehydrogenase/meso-butanediol dehydrogenase/diacetyl reductase
MRAARFYAAGDVRIEDVPAPTGELGPHEVLVRNRECGICGTDLHEYSHGPVYTSAEPHRVTGVSLPTILGHEFSGLVEAIGTEVRSVRPGDRVAIMPQVFCGRCPQCMAGRQQTCMNLAAVGLTWPWGGFAEHAVVGEAQVAALPDSMSDAAGALVEPTAVALHAVSSAPVRPGDTVLVTGAGPIGQLVALAAVAAGAGAVVLSEPSAGRRERAAALGVTAVIDPLAEDATERIAELTGGAGAEVCIECAGSQPALDACLAAVRLGGTIVQTALHTRPVQIDAGAQLTLRDVTIKGVYCYPVTSWPRVIGLIASARLPAERIVTGEIELGNLVADGLDALLERDGDQVKILVQT